MLNILAGAVAVMALCSVAYAEETQATIAARAGTLVLEVHALGAQIYECKADADGHRVWQFREPIASLMRDGKTVGRHFAGPAWETEDGDRVVGRVIARAPGTASGDIPWLRLSVSEHRGDGMLSGVTTVQRINTIGGGKAGPCTAADTLVAEPYGADYLFSRP